MQEIEVMMTKKVARGLAKTYMKTHSDRCPTCDGKFVVKGKFIEVISSNMAKLICQTCKAEILLQ